MINNLYLRLWIFKDLFISLLNIDDLIEHVSKSVSIPLISDLTYLDIS